MHDHKGCHYKASSDTKIPATANLLFSQLVLGLTKHYNGTASKFHQNFQLEKYANLLTCKVNSFNIFIEM